MATLSYVLISILSKFDVFVIGFWYPQGSRLRDVMHIPGGLQPLTLPCTLGASSFKTSAHLSLPVALSALSPPPAPLLHPVLYLSTLSPLRRAWSEDGESAEREEDG